MIRVAGIEIGNSLPLTVIGGINVLESEERAMEVCREFVTATAALGMGFIFKGSFDKANRTSVESYRGPGLERGLEILKKIKERYNVPIITDIHEPWQAEYAANVADVIQLPAFLARQTDLIQAIAKTNRPANIKKPQNMSPADVAHIVRKFKAFEMREVMVTERGTMFGYDNLVVDMLGLDSLRQNNTPVILDVTHSLQRREPGAKASGGRREQAASLMRAGVAVGVAGIFVEAHPSPNTALCDGPSTISLSKLQQFLMQAKLIDDTVKKML